MALSSSFVERLRSAARLAGQQVLAASMTTGEVIRALKLRSPESTLVQLTRLLAGSPLGTKLQRYGGEAWLVMARWPILRSVLSAAGLTQPAPSRPASPVVDVVARSPRDVQQAVEVLKHDPEWSRRAQAAGRLSGATEAEARDALTAALKDSSAEVAVAAVDALSQGPSSAVLPMFREVLANADGFYSPVVRAAVIGSLVDSADPNDRAAVQDAVRDLDAEVSLAAIAAVAEKTPETAAARLLPILNDESGYYLPVVRLAAVTALERSHAMAPSLAVELLPSEADGSVRTVLERIAESGAPVD